MNDLSFDKFEEKSKDKTSEKEKEVKEKEVFQKIPEEDKDTSKLEDARKYLKEEIIPVPFENPNGSNSYLSLVLSPNFQELELMIRGLEYVKRYNPLTNREEVILRKIPNHPLNEYGINTIISELKIYCSSEIKLGRKSEKAYFHSINHVSHSIIRLIYKNLKNFGMDTQVKQRNAKRFCNAIIEMLDAAYSRSIGGQENDLSRATELKIEGNINPTNLYENFGKNKEQLKN